MQILDLHDAKIIQTVMALLRKQGTLEIVKM